MDHSDTLSFIEYSICGSNIDPMQARECELCESVWIPEPVEQNIYYAVELDTMYICFKHFSAMALSRCEVVSEMLWKPWGGTKRFVQ